MAQAAGVMAIVGVGPGLGAAVARRFAREGYAVGLMARSEANLTPVAEEVERAGGQALSVPVDATDPGAVPGAFAQVRAAFGDPGVLVYNAGSFQPGGILEIDPAGFEANFRANCTGALLAAQQVLPAMVQRGEGTVLLTGATAALRGGARFANLAVGKFGLRALGQSMAREFQPQGVHVAHIIVDGQIDNPRTRSRVGSERAEHTMLAPDAIAETYWQLHAQHPSAWTQEIDLRPHVEKF